MKQFLNINVSNTVRSIRAIRVQINGILVKQFLNINVSNTVRSIRAIRVQINGILWGNFWTLLFQTLFVPFDSRAA